ncbi:fibronectin type III-like domain-contianing protein [Kitasatospora sp. NPDC001540]|uniref:fibronectin type III-like domain-contianing protein n=1 Tax=Kitasatospora sp. NPDC001540 TaxID=3364014 RepID=UPI0036BD144D
MIREKRPSARVTFTVTAQDLSTWQSGAWCLTPGLYALSAGRSSRDLPVQRTITLG